MSANFFLPNPADTDFPFTEDWEVAQWTAEGGATIVKARYEGDSERPSVMQVTSDTDGKGVYYTITGISASTLHCFRMSYKNASSQEIDYIVYDVTGSANIKTGTLTATNWSYHYEELTSPAGCVSIRIYLRAGTSGGASFYIDDLQFQGNAIIIDPDDYEITYRKAGTSKPMLDGTRRTDYHMTEIEIPLTFSIATSTQFDKLLDIHKSNKATYFNDLDVPSMIQRQAVYTETTYTFSGITNPSTTHIAYESKSASEPSASSDFQTTEFTTADYTEIGADDANSVQDSASSTGHYQYHKFIFKCSGEYTSAADIQGFSVIYKGCSNDASSSNQDGVSLYLWNVNAGNWVKIGTNRVTVNETISYSTTKPEQAQMFVDISGGVIRILAQTNGTKGAGTALTLDTYYVEATVNESLSNTISLLNRATLTAGDVVYVKNLTQGTTLILTTNYRIGADGDSVIVTSGTSAGDVLEVKYNQYYRVQAEALRERRLPTGTYTTPPRVVTLQLTGLIGLE